MANDKIHYQYNNFLHILYYKVQYSNSTINVKGFTLKKKKKIGKDVEIDTLIHFYIAIRSINKLSLHFLKVICHICISNVMEQVNSGLLSLCAEKENESFIDVTSIFKLEDGSFNDGFVCEDGVH